ncbi:MAG: amidohydrolase [Myxococcales bacterium]|nr:amidohydrolase [Myxococcales bacterium]
MDRSIPDDVFCRMVALRRDLHRHPELSWQEHDTMQRISTALTALGLEHRTGLAGTGIMADLDGRAPGPRIALRADTDALPIQEETGLPFASEVPGVMHACGHDGHTSMLVGAAELLLADPPPTPVRLIWQPAEEAGDGAKAMIEAGALDGVSLIFGGHVDRSYPPGELIVTDGAVNGSTDTFRITFTGQRGHAARPHSAVDAIVVASHFVTTVQAAISREVDPGQPAVVTVGQLRAGSAPNVIAGEAVLEGTFRTQHPDVRAHLASALPRIAEAVAQQHRAAATVQLQPGTPPLINEPGPTRLARRAALDIADASAVRPLATANLGGEDFAWYLEEIEGAYIRYGAQPPGKSFPAHSGGFDIHEDVLAVGARWLDRVARVAGDHLLAEGT